MEVKIKNELNSIDKNLVSLNDLYFETLFDLALNNRVN